MVKDRRDSPSCGKGFLLQGRSSGRCVAELADCLAVDHLKTTV
jgi:uncharacterized protein YbbK (DUF523 family)